MTLRKTRLAVALGLAAGLFVPVSAFATNGYFDYGYGTKDKGMAGAGVALPQDSMAAATNPAGMVFVGNRLDLGAAYFQPIRQYTATGGVQPTGGGFGTPPNNGFDTPDGTYGSGDNWFLIPHFGYNQMLSSDSSVGVDLYGNGGMNTWYDGSRYGATCPGTFCSGTAGVDLEQLFLSGTYAQKVTNDASLGISLIGVEQRFKAYGIGALSGYSSQPTAFSNNGYSNSHGLGVRIGGQVDVGYGVSLGAAYQPKIKMSKFSKYAGLFADQGEFDIPANWTIGGAYKINPQNAVLLDVQKIYYSKVNSVGDGLNPAGLGGGTTQFGNSGGPGFGWQDMTIYKVGYQFAYNPVWTWRVGYSHTTQPIQSSQVLLNVLAPGVIQDHYTAGFTYQMSSAGEFDLAAMYAPSHTVTGQNAFDPSQTISTKMHEYELEANWGMKF